MSITALWLNSEHGHGWSRETAAISATLPHPIDLDGLADMRAVIGGSVLSQDVDEEMVLLELTSGAYYGLNEVGSRVWVLLSEGKTLGQVLQTILEEYQAPEDMVKADLAKFLTELQARGLVELKHASSA